MSSDLYAISMQGLTNERAKIEAASANIANMNMVASDPSQVYRLKRVDFSASLTGQAVLTEVHSVKTNYQPEHPLADKQGFIYQPDVNLASEMLQLNLANRAYEANIRAFNALKDMNSKAMEIGK
ncbi:flagellar basal body rod protein FlgC [Arsukibacterium perlucidum]|uniref:flagellar basal body rod protein FlgC n=1 Tax=Arsukibacterium perlucidum TaxID=368811 RepID=UPI000A07A1FF|nr:flagellar basal body rod C-terminal domain-containing protein [Arsukibacterium perlucidum]